MFLVVIRSDLRNPLFLSDIESISQTNPTTETPKGQAKYVSRPKAASIQAYLDSQSLTASAAGLITATVPGYAGGSSVPTVDISATAIKAVTGLSGATNAQVVHLQNMLGYHIVETDFVKKSVLAGCLHGLLSSSFNPDSRGALGHPPATAGQAIKVVQDVNALSTSTTLLTVKTPIITGLTLSGTLTVTGASGGLAGYGLYEPTVIITGSGGRQITQAKILAAGGTVSDTSIVVPASLIGTTATVLTVPATGKTWVRVQVNDMLSNKFAL
jgi:hypothetical protein